MQTQESQIQRAVARIRREAFSKQLQGLKSDGKVHPVGGCEILRVLTGFFIFGKAQTFVDLETATDIVLGTPLRPAKRPG